MMQRTIARGRTAIQASLPRLASRLVSLALAVLIFFPLSALSLDEEIVQIIPESDLKSVRTRFTPKTNSKELIDHLATALSDEGYTVESKDQKRGVVIASLYEIDYSATGSPTSPFTDFGIKKANTQQNRVVISIDSRHRRYSVIQIEALLKTIGSQGGILSATKVLNKSAYDALFSATAKYIPLYKKRDEALSVRSKHKKSKTPKSTTKPSDAP